MIFEIDLIHITPHSVWAFNKNGIQVNGSQKEHSSKYSTILGAFLGTFYTIYQQYGFNRLYKEAKLLTGWACKETLFSPLKLPPIVFNKCAYFENKFMNVIQSKLPLLFSLDFDKLMDIESSFTIGTIYQLFINATFGRFYKSISFWKKQQLIDLKDKEFYQELVPYFANDNVSDDILLEILEYSGIENGENSIRSYIDKSNNCMVRYEKNYSLIYSVRIIITILFTFYSYRQYK